MHSACTYVREIGVYLIHLSKCFARILSESDSHVQWSSSAVAPGSLLQMLVLSTGIAQAGGTSVFTWHVYSYCIT